MIRFGQDPASLAQAAEILRRGDLVAFPTETVYGLGADARNPDAVAKLFALKGRPQFNPLICHVADIDAAQKIGVLNDMALLLAAHFWPGPLTLVVPRQANCPVDLLACAGLPTIALRVPANPTAQALLVQCQFPVAAPSANMSGRISPTHPAHVTISFPDITVIDGGACAVGLESSIVGCFEDTLYWLRAGGIARCDIEAIIGRSLESPPSEREQLSKLAPGRLARHYAPTHQLVISDMSPQRDDALISFGGAETEHTGLHIDLSPTGDLTQAAARLYAALYEMDQALTSPQAKIIIRPLPEDGLGEAIMDRLRRAATPADQ